MKTEFVGSPCPICGPSARSWPLWAHHGDRFIGDVHISPSCLPSVRKCLSVTASQPREAGRIVRDGLSRRTYWRSKEGCNQDKPGTGQSSVAAIAAQGSDLSFRDWLRRRCAARGAGESRPKRQRCGARRGIRKLRTRVFRRHENRRDRGGSEPTCSGPRPRRTGA
jgi:hypothetical protein